MRNAKTLPENGHARQRRCIVTGDVMPEGRLVRFVSNGEGFVVPDVAAKLPGRGLWVTSDGALIHRAADKKLFARAARSPLQAEADLAGQTEERLAAHMLDMLGLARRAGALVLGFDAIERALRGAEPPAVLIAAADGAAEGKRKLQAAARARGVAPYVIGFFTNAELSLALGKANVVHAALKAGRIAERLIFDAGRLAGFRPAPNWEWAGYSDSQAREAEPPLRRYAALRPGEDSNNKGDERPE